MIENCGLENRKSPVLEELYRALPSGGRKGTNYPLYSYYP